MTHCRLAQPVPHWRDRGFTLIEILVTFAVLAVMLTLAAPSFVAFQRNAELTTTANKLMAAMTLARSEAMKRQMTAYVEAGSPSRPAGTQWSTGWFVYVDVNGNGSYGAGDIVLLQNTDPLPASVGVNRTAAANAFKDSASGTAYVMFVGSGFLRQADGSFNNEGMLELFNVVGGEMRCVHASPAGRLRVFRPAAGEHCAVAALPES